MSTTTHISATVAALLLMGAADRLQAQELDFEFSDDLQASFEALEEDRIALREEIAAAVEGLSGADRQAVLEDYADDVEALRDTEKELRDEGVAEMEEAGYDIPDAPDDGPRGGPGNGRGGPGGGAGRPRP